MVKNILIVGHSNIGDVCYDLAVVNPLLKEFPQARITFLTSPRCEAIASRYSGIDKVIVMEKRKTDKGLLGRLPFICSLRKEGFDLAVVLVNTLMYFFLGIPKVLTFHKLFGKKFPKNIHIVESYRTFLNSYGIDFKKATFNFKNEHAAFRDQLLEQGGISSNDQIVGILPLAAWSLKNWPVAYWNRLSGLLGKERGFKVIAFGKSVPNEFNEYVLKNLSQDIVSVIDKTNLAQALALIKRCDYFIGPDSGLLHLASCMNVKTIGLYGATSRNFIYPYFHRDNVIGSPAKISCMPCYPGNIHCERQGKSFCGQCMEEISVEEVLRAIH
jgi:ADP-heptose:LPS heptosyltransferase